MADPNNQDSEEQTQEGMNFVDRMEEASERRQKAEQSWRKWCRWALDAPRDALFRQVIEFVVPDARTMDIDEVLERCPRHLWILCVFRHNGQRVRVDYFDGDFLFEYPTPEIQTRAGWTCLAMLKKFAQSLPQSDTVELEIGSIGGEDFAPGGAYILRKSLVEGNDSLPLDPGFYSLQHLLSGE